MMRKKLSMILDAAPDIMVVGSAANPEEARHLIKVGRPDVLTLDVQMPQMDGLTFLGQIMQQRPMPVVMIAGNSTANTDTILTAMEIGAVDFVTKPANRDGWAAFPSTICNTVRIAAEARIDPDRPAADKKLEADKNRPRSCRLSDNKAHQRSGFSLVAIGASTGGITAITRLLAEFDKSALFPPIVIAQHMPAGFTARFADRLAQTTGQDVAEALDGERLHCGMIRIAPGDRHLRIGRISNRPCCKISHEPPIENHRPSINTLFTSIARSAGQPAIGVILTGMGHDGAKGLLAMREAGATTLGESRSSCTVYGMPGAAKRMGAVCEELDIAGIAARLQALLGHKQQPVSYSTGGS